MFVLVRSHFSSPIRFQNSNELIYAEMTVNFGVMAPAAFDVVIVVVVVADDDVDLARVLPQGFSICRVCSFLLFLLSFLLLSLPRVKS